MSTSPLPATERLRQALANHPSRIVACSGGIDSLVLATVAHRLEPGRTGVVHTVTPAVAADGTARVVAYGRQEGWDLNVVRSKEFDDERYLSNPTDRCYYCKTHLYDAIAEFAPITATNRYATVLSGANVDDLGEYRPGLLAAAEHGVRHPYIEAGLGKADVRAIARQLGLAEAELPASPCLASRLYTGTRVSAARLHAVEAGEAVLRALAGVAVARCRIRSTEVLVEVPEADRDKVSDGVLAAVGQAMTAISPSLSQVSLDDRPYRPGQAVLPISINSQP
jgi:uncharacterized protein